MAQLEDTINVGCLWRVPKRDGAQEQAKREALNRRACCGREELISSYRAVEEECSIHVGRGQCTA